MTRIRNDRYWRDVAHHLTLIYLEIPHSLEGRFALQMATRPRLLRTIWNDKLELSPARFASELVNQYAEK